MDQVINRCVSLLGLADILNALPRGECTRLIPPGKRNRVEHCHSGGVLVVSRRPYRAQHADWLTFHHADGHEPRISGHFFERNFKFHPNVSCATVPSAQSALDGGNVAQRAVVMRARQNMPQRQNDPLAY